VCFYQFVLLRGVLRVFVWSLCFLWKICWWLQSLLEADVKRWRLMKACVRQCCCVTLEVEQHLHVSPVSWVVHVLSALTAPQLFDDVKKMLTSVFIVSCFIYLFLCLWNNVYQPKHCSFAYQWMAYFYNGEMTHSISNEPEQGLVMWIKRSHDASASSRRQSITFTSSISFGLNQHTL